MVRRLLVAIVIVPVVAAAAALGTAESAGASTVVYSHTWSPPLNLPSNYRPCCPSTAGFTTLPFTMNVKGTQQSVLTVRMKTNWVDTKAMGGTPNIIQQGRVALPTEIKISIHSGQIPGAHHAQCRVAGHGVVINAQGPKSIDVANGAWHTITCVKYADSSLGSNVRVDVDGVVGPVYHSSARLGDLIWTTDKVDLGGQGPKANKDSIDGQYASVRYTVG